MNPALLDHLNLAAHHLNLAAGLLETEHGKDSPDAEAILVLFDRVSDIRMAACTSP